jgi:dinuclear metal center YbgI/SA1388 family protein
MTVKELYSYFDAEISRALSCDWDNDGAMCIPDSDREVRKVLVVLDVTEEAVDAAINMGADVIISHHPLIFKGIKSVSDSAYTKKLVKLIKNDIAVFSFHTRLDALDGGVNDTLAAALGLSYVEKLGSSDTGLGRVGVLDSEMSSEDFAKLVKEKLRCPFVLLSSSGKPSFKVALVGGEGSDEIRAAIAAGADTFVSGRLGYHNMVDAKENGINLIEAGHFFTEYPVCARLADMVHKADNGIETEIIFTNKIKAI